MMQAIMAYCARHGEPFEIATAMCDLAEEMDIATMADPPSLTALLDRARDRLLPPAPLSRVEQYARARHATTIRY
jgi:hypothetical protein